MYIYIWGGGGGLAKTLLFSSLFILWTCLTSTLLIKEAQMKEKMSVYVYIYLLICVCKCIQTVFVYELGKKDQFVRSVTSTSKCLSTVVNNQNDDNECLSSKNKFPLCCFDLCLMVTHLLHAYFFLFVSPSLFFCICFVCLSVSLSLSLNVKWEPAPTGHFTNVKRHKFTCVFSIVITHHPITGLYTSPLAPSSWCHRVCRACKCVA